MNSPVFGSANAPVTVVEFFDPSCEACRAFYPYVKQILAENPNDVRLVLRYVLFHGSPYSAPRRASELVRCIAHNDEIHLRDRPVSA